MGVGAPVSAILKPKLMKECTVCGTPYPGNDIKFCGECGTKRPGPVIEKPGMQMQTPSTSDPNTAGIFDAMTSGASAFQRFSSPFLDFLGSSSNETYMWTKAGCTWAGPEKENFLLR